MEVIILKYLVIKFISKTLSLLPLSFVRFIGSICGIIFLRFSSRAYKRIKTNLLLTAIANENNVDKIALNVTKNFGMTIFETLVYAWNYDTKFINSIIKKVINFENVKIDINNKYPILFLTPHIGNFEIAVKYTFDNLDKNITVIYKPTKLKWFNKLMLIGRKHNKINWVSTNQASSVISLFRALKNKECAGILPDSVASNEGVFVEFFGKQVFATTLSAKLGIKENVKTYIVNSIRTNKGFYLEYIPIIFNSNNINDNVQKIYHEIEKLVRRHPEQYFWSYDRFRRKIT